ncbi:hypothetical protein EN853_13705 [Mesorhizobium sp. M1C.F.Ca.ET.210.01.1.1]|uniref:hypothetical protein n=1 Tax=unclassified Mesorhizobium TaxID=325217 RepID=UPI000FD2C4A7|nr:MULTISPECIES: hypothetical protein [unclassified Mesorhizobium]TGQ53676.1 hypothetical protein EN853_13705 [Mesorhizobium sp. M1C.F.Ca.ET.210.01.1.1]TGR28690.1 hypothetical protein EN839_13710 [Mesorhizobium sp. M1C.F.Ca.ET.196.01.1.1]TGS04449.1 hypothetical protein EN831_13775 [Mesorhizobium sp. M1C.F.Ca.ET.188.01.1.1]TGT00271.1 hypothetical protein EN820_32435 [bacterium M00.F.Ca.ET.177.01.1.1]
MNVVGRTVLLFLAAAFAAGACSTLAVADDVSTPLLTSPATKLIGVAAWGPQADLDRLQAFTKKSGFPSEQITDAPEGAELFIVFPPGSDASAVAAFIDRLRGGEFPTLRFGSATAPVKE